MRTIGALLLLAGLTFAEGDPFRGATRLATGAQGRVTVKVPQNWSDLEVTGSAIIRVRAPGSYGGHDLIIAREAGQGEVEKQRARYLEYDSGKRKSATVKQVAQPYFGYRLNLPESDRILCRAFLRDGDDGLVISVTSRFRNYDRFWAKLVEAILASVRVREESGKGGGAGERRRIYDRAARVSIVVPPDWKSLEPDSDKTLLFVAHKGARRGPRFLIQDARSPLQPNLLLLKIASQWKRTYGGGLRVTRLEDNDPPRILVKNRIPGSIDYLIAFSAGGSGYLFRFTCREEEFESYRARGEEFAKTIVFAAAEWTPPEIEPRELTETYRKLARVHANVGEAGSIEGVVEALPGFEKHWPRLAPTFDKRAPPLEILLVGADEFKRASHFYGRPPAAYDRSTRVVVLVAPRPKEPAAAAAWVGRLYGALGEAALHRDLAVAAPPWLRAGLRGCIEAAGRSGKSPKEPHNGYLDRLLARIGADGQPGLREIIKMTEADLRMDRGSDLRVHAWGYVHMLLYGKSRLGAAYRKWARALASARGATPAFDLKGYPKDRQDLAQHAARNWK